MASTVASSACMRCAIASPAAPGAPARCARRLAAGSALPRICSSARVAICMEGALTLLVTAAAAGSSGSGAVAAVDVCAPAATATRLTRRTTTFALVVAGAEDRASITHACVLQAAALAESPQ